VTILKEKLIGELFGYDKWQMMRMRMGYAKTCILVVIT